MKLWKIRENQPGDLCSRDRDRGQNERKQLVRSMWNVLFYQRKKHVFRGCVRCSRKNETTGRTTKPRLEKHRGFARKVSRRSAPVFSRSWKRVWVRLGKYVVFTTSSSSCPRVLWVFQRERFLFKNETCIFAFQWRRKIQKINYQKGLIHRSAF